jgi:hypothetical protein
MNRKLRILQYGLGPIGCLMAQIVIERADSFELVGAIDIDPSKAGKDLGEVLGIGRKLGINVNPNAAEAIESAAPDVVLHSTGSYLREVGEQILLAVQAGADVISTCEELAYPWVRNPNWASEIDRRAKENGATVLGTGINPGFIMDLMLITITGMCRNVRKVSARRVVNASERRLPLQRKIGAGLPPNEFLELVNSGKVRHVGLVESVDMLASALGWNLNRVEENITPVISETRIETRHLQVEPGHVAGVRQIATGFENDIERVVLDLEMYVGARDPGDHLHVDGEPPISMHVRGIHGDVSTAAVAVNCIPFVESAPPGLVSMKDLPTVCWRSARHSG